MEDTCKIIHVRESLYLASYNEILAVVREASPSLHALAIVAHNPGITDLANFFLQESIHNIPTSGFVYMAFESDTWEEARSERMVKHAFHYPKELLME